MGYELSIARDQPISLEEWREAAAANDKVRLHETDSIAINPVAGQKLVMPGQPGGASLHIDSKWVEVFRWRHGTVTFNAPASTTATDPIMFAALKLATALSATIVGEEGETYDGAC